MAKPNAPESEGKGDSFDLDKFRKLLQLMEKYGVSEANLQNDQESWKVRRGPRTVSFGGPQMPMSMPGPAMQAPMAGQAGSAAAQPSAAQPEKPAGITINAPTVGTFYSAASPEDEAFVSVGSVVKPDSIVCIIEAMKVFNQIQSEKSGRIVEILVSNGDAVEFGQPLFRLEPA